MAVSRISASPCVATAWRKSSRSFELTLSSWLQQRPVQLVIGGEARIVEVRRRGCRHGRGAGLSAVLGGMSAGIELCPIAAAEPYSLAAGAACAAPLRPLSPWKSTVSPAKSGSVVGRFMVAISGDAPATRLSERTNGPILRALLSISIGPAGVTFGGPIYFGTLVCCRPNSASAASRKRVGAAGRSCPGQFRESSVRVVRLFPSCPFSERGKGASNPLKLRLGA